ncbi:MAG: hypothetical protein HRT44_13560 [Bdellovibrionales bacterium]|nr:hypothetical protein [Bdellovibrionales bacterium]
MLTLLVVLLSFFSFKATANTDLSCEQETIEQIHKKKNNRSDLKRLGSFDETQFKSHYQKTMSGVSYSEFYIFMTTTRTCRLVKFKNYIKSKKWKETACSSLRGTNSELSCFEKLVKKQSLQSATEILLLSVVATGQFTEYKNDENKNSLNLRLANLLLDLIIQFDVNQHILRKYKGKSGFITFFEKLYLNYTEENLFSDTQEKIIEIAKNRINKVKTNLNHRLPADEQTQQNLQQAISLIEKKIKKVQNMPNIDL